MAQTFLDKHLIKLTLKKYHSNKTSLNIAVSAIAIYRTQISLIPFLLNVHLMIAI